MNIVSLLPSATEIVCALGAGDELVARSHECDFPAHVSRLPVVTAPKVRVDGNSEEIHASVTEVLRNDISVYSVDAELLRALKPDVIVTQVQCDVCAVSLRDVEASIAEWIGGSAPQIVALNPSTLETIYEDIERVAVAIGRDAQSLIGSMRRRMRAVATQNRPRVATIEWISPLMTAGNWIPELIELAGGENIFGVAGQHSPWITLDAFVAADPDIIVVFPCGFSIERALADMPLLETQLQWNDLRAVREGRVFVADGNQYFNRPGPRIVESMQILAAIINDESDPLLEQRQGFRVVAPCAAIRSAV